MDKKIPSFLNEKLKFLQSVTDSTDTHIIVEIWKVIQFNKNKQKYTLQYTKI